VTAALQLQTMVAAAVIVGLLFVLGAAVQHNDPDPLRWALIYLAAAATSFTAALRRLPQGVPLVVGICALAWAAALAPQVLGLAEFAAMFRSWEMADIHVEESREFWGLAIIAGWMVVLSVFHRLDTTSGSKDTATLNSPKG
jgi:hypothetical protein